MVRLDLPEIRRPLGGVKTIWWMDVARAANRLTARWAQSISIDGSLALSGAGLWPIIALLASAAKGRPERS